MSQENKIIRVGSRKSELALIQTRHVISCLEKLHPNKTFEIHTMTTIGDRVLNISLPKIGEKALFTKDLEDALRTVLWCALLSIFTDTGTLKKSCCVHKIENRELKLASILTGLGGVDLVVHSLKDLPTVLPTGMAIGAVLEREDPHDALVLNMKHKGLTLDTLPAGSVIGTSSLRRSAQLSRSHPHLKVTDVRGNLNTRLAKLDNPELNMSGLLLAHAGLVRMGWNHRIDQTLDCETSLYAIGQGALAVECRSQDPFITQLIASLTHKPTLCRVIAERSFLRTLGGGCSAPVAISSDLKTSTSSSSTSDNNLELCVTGAVWSLDGSIHLQHKLKRNIKYNETDKVANDTQCPTAKRLKLMPSHNNNEFLSKKDTLLTAPNISDTDNTSNVANVASNEVRPCDGINDNGNHANTCADIESLINAHGDLMNKCPHNTDGHLNLPVGQDFMGQCPFLEKKGFDSILQCSFRPTEGNSEMCCPLRVDKTSKCYQPEAGDQTSSIGQLRLEKCPFLNQNQVKLIDYIRPDEEISVIDEDNVDESNLYCGILQQDNISCLVMRECELLGQELADMLIKKGALDVMKSAQMQIRSG